MELGILCELYLKRITTVFASDGFGAWFCIWDISITLWDSRQKNTKLVRIRNISIYILLPTKNEEPTRHQILYWKDKIKLSALTKGMMFLTCLRQRLIPSIHWVRTVVTGFPLRETILLPNRGVLSVFTIFSTRVL